MEKIERMRVGAIGVYCSCGEYLEKRVATAVSAPKDTKPISGKVFPGKILEIECPFKEMNNCPTIFICLYPGKGIWPDEFFEADGQ